MLKNTWGYIRLNLIEIFKSFVEEISQKIKKSMLMRVCSAPPPLQKKIFALKNVFFAQAGILVIFKWIFMVSVPQIYTLSQQSNHRCNVFITNELYEAQTTNRQRSQYIHVFVFSIGVTGASCHNVIISKTISF